MATRGHGERRRGIALERWQPGRGLMRGPFRELSRMEREVEDLFGRFFRDGSFPRLFGAGRGVAPAVDLLDTKDAVILRGNLPGLDQKESEVTVEEGTLTLPSGVDAEQIETTFKQGVREIHLPKVEKPDGKKIEIKGVRAQARVDKG